MTPPPRISVVVPIYRRKESVLLLLANIYQQEGVSFEVIVVDDCSSDDTADAIAAQFPAVKLLRNAVNAGPAVSRNRGVRAAKGEFIVGFDSDVTVPDRKLFDGIVSTFAKYPRATGLALRVVEPDGRTDDAPRWCHVLPIKYAERHFETHYFSGTGYAFRRESMLSAKLFPEILYMHYEEVELALRILDAGGTILHCPDIRVLHHVHPIAARSKIEIFYKPRNQILFSLACHSWPRVAAYLLPRVVYNFVQAVSHRHLNELGAAFLSARQLAPQVLSQRAPLKPNTWRVIKRLKSPAWLNKS